MPRPAIDLSRKIKDCLKHVQPLPPEADTPIAHYGRTSADLWNTMLYVERAFDLAEDNLYQGVAERHLGRLNEMILVNLIETFERFLKEAAAACVEHLGRFILDDRFNVFGGIQGSGLASHFGTASLGKALCESSTWLDCEEINKRFRRLLSDPFQQGGSWFDLFPKQPVAAQQKYETLSLIWQLRHTLVHNVGVITQSDAVKLRLWAKEAVDSPLVLLPTRDDIRYHKRFLDGLAEECNQRIGKRLADLLTTLHQSDPTLFDDQAKANEISLTFGTSLSIATKTGSLPP